MKVIFAVAAYIAAVWVAYAIIRIILSDPENEEDIAVCWMIAALWPALSLIGIFWGIGKLTDRWLIWLMKRKKEEESREEVH